MCVCGAPQVVAALCELAIPHFATKSIFAAAEGASSAAFQDYLQLLMVSPWGGGGDGGLGSWYGKLAGRPSLVVACM